MNIAIVIGISEYAPNPMDAAKNDAQRMYRLLSATNKFQQILSITDNTTAVSVKDRVRSFLRSFGGQQVDEILFYYSGHGLHDAMEREFFMLCSDYDKARRSSTSLQNSEIDSFIRALKPRLTVKLVDACYSGFRYVKSDPFEQPDQQNQEDSLGNVIFMSSSHDNQTSAMIAGDSYFTAKFIEGALLLKIGNEVLYRDIEGYIADEFRNMSKQTPYFTRQGAGTEVFSSYTDAMKALKEEWYPGEVKAGQIEATHEEQSRVEAPSGDPDDRVLAEIASAVESHDELFVDEDVITSTMLKVKSVLSGFRIAETTVAPFYEARFLWDRDLSQLEKSWSLTELAVEADWPQQYFVEFKTKPARVKVPRRSALSQMRFMAGQENESDFIFETHNKPSSLKSTHALPFELIWVEFSPTRPSLVPFYAIAALVHSETHLLTVWARGQMIKDSWRHHAIDWNVLEWVDVRFTWKSVVEDATRIWEPAINALLSEMREYLASLTKVRQ